MHATLAQQLRQALKVNSQIEAESLLGNLFDGARTPALNGLQTLLGMVDESYRQFERAQELRLRSLSTSSTELLQANERLRGEAARQHSLIDAMRATANRLLSARGREPIAADENSVERLTQVMDDLITESETAHTRVIESESRFRDLTSLSSDWYWEEDASHRFTLMSQGIKAVTGKNPDDFLGLTRMEAFSGDDAPSHDAARQRLMRIMQNRQPFREFELCYVAPGRDLIYLTLSGEPYFDAQGQFTGYRGVGRNITLRKQAEQHYQDALRLTETLLDVTPTPITIKDAELRFVRVNDAFVQMFEMAHEQWVGKTAREVRGDDAARSEAEERELLRRPRVLRYEQKRMLLSGAELHYIVTKAPMAGADGGVSRIITTYNDVTELKRTQGQLTQQLGLTDALIESIPMPVSIKDREHRFVRVNAAYEQAFNVRRTNVVGYTAIEVLPDHTRGGHPVEEEMLLNPGVRSYTRKRTLVDGSEKYFAITKAAIRGENGEVSGFITTHADVTDLKQAEQKVEDQLQLTNVILETSPEPMMVKDGNRKITYVNAAYEKLFGVDRKEFLACEMRNHTNGVLEDIERIELDLLANPGTRQFEYTLPTVDGRDVYCIITKSTFVGRSGDIGGIITTYTDITRLKDAERGKAEQLRLTTNLLDASPIATVVKDTNLVLTRCNTAYEALFEVRREDMLNLPMSAHRTEFNDTVTRIERALLEKPGTHRVERAIKSPSGKVIFCIVSKSTYFNEAGEVEGIITTFTDISEIKRTEESLTQAKHVAEQAMRARSQFLANMSHEIRTPMNGVLGMASVLAGTPLDSRQQEYLATIQVSGESLLKIVNDILDFSKIEAGKVEIEKTPFDLRSRLASVMQLFAAAAREKNITMTHVIDEDVPTRIVGDAVRISQTLSNMLGNAIKFTESGGISLNVTAQAWEGEQVILRFDVRDTGIGISQTAIERIFDPFSQEDASTTRRFGGTGLGLTISRQLAGLMGGELFVESKQGEGSCFSFTVAVSDAGDAAVGDNIGNATTEMHARIVSRGLADGKTQGAQGIDVLLAEDNNVNQIVACAMLKKLGCTITVAKDGQEALEHVKVRHFDLILMDCHMPNLDGFAATAAIRELEKQGGPRHIIIAQTANAMEGDRESCLAAGMDDYISKPIAANALAEVIQRWTPARSESMA